MESQTHAAELLDLGASLLEETASLDEDFSSGCELELSSDCELEDFSSVLDTEVSLTLLEESPSMLATASGISEPS